MAHQLQVFENDEFGRVRAVEVDGLPWFVGKDVACALGYSNTKDALRQHVDAEDKAILQRSQNTTFEIPPRGFSIINESGLYSLILSSKLPAAKKFKRWVTSEVLPSIRNHGVYITEEVLDEILHSQEFAFDLFKKLDEERKKTSALETLAEELAPKAIYCDLILRCGNAVPVSLIAKDYGYSAASFNKLLHDLRIQYKIAGTWLLYQNHAGNGYTKTTTHCVEDRIARMHTRWTQAGRLFLYDKLKGYGYLPLMESGGATLH